MIEPRIYRTAFIPAVLAAVLVMFSLENRPRPVPQGLAADVLFDGDIAHRELRKIVARHPDRQPGELSSAAVARDLAERFRALEAEGFETSVDSWDENEERLVNVTARRPGASRDQIVIMAARDSQSVPDATGSAADTAALLELARVISGRPSRKTLVLASVDGSTLGDAGARRFARTAEDRDRIEAVIVLSNLGASQAHGPLVIAWSNDDSRGSIGLQRTATASLREELGTEPSEEGALGQLVRLAHPLGLGAQGPLLADGIEAVRISGSGELPPPDDQRGLEDVSVDRLGQLGRATLRLVSSLDNAPDAPDHGPNSYVAVARKILPGWVLGIFAATLLFPALVASIDALARARRRREVAPGWWRTIALWSLPFLAAFAMAELLVLFDQAPDAGAAPSPPGVHPLDGGAVAALGACAATALLVWLLVRPRLTRRFEAAGSGGAAATSAIALGLAVLAVWVLNAYAALFLVPALHVWMIAMLSGARLSKRGAVAVVFAGLLAPLVAAIIYLDRLSLDPLEGLWYLWVLVTGHAVSPVTTVLACICAAVGASTLSVIVARVGVPPPLEPE
ncbi:MAG: M28 family peptidase, partial [Actinomycetota bacterium]|nr:M28 family peptidase [Actinomycetota bacterium]